MTATAAFRPTSFGPLVPSKGTLAVAANVLIIGGTIVTVDADGRADVVTAGQHAAGIAHADYDNRTTAPEGGGAGAIDAEIKFGIAGLEYTGTAPNPGQVVYVVDNQTVSTDSDSGSRGIAGYCSELRDGLCWVLMGPTVVGQIVIAATEAAQLDNLQADVIVGEELVPITAFTKAAGAPLVAFSDGVSDGLVTSEGIMYRFNVGSTDPIWTTIPMPSYLDGSEDVIIDLLVSREGATDTDVVCTVGAYFVSASDVYTADTDCGGDTAAISEATTAVVEKSVTIDAADVPASPLLLSFSVVPSALLDSDDLNIHGAIVKFSRALTS
jgi:hypothetical protein